MPFRRLVGILICFFSLVPIVALCQNDEPYELPQNSIYLEMLGNGFLGSINYERITFDRSGDFSVCTRVGLSYLKSVIIPVEASVVINKFEVGIGLTTLANPIRSATLVRVGFKTILRNNLLLRIGLTPRIAGAKGEIPPIGGISVGKAF